MIRAVLFVLRSCTLFVCREQNGTGDNFEEAYAIAMAGDGSVVVAGVTEGDYEGGGLSNSLERTESSDDYADFLAVKLDENGTQLWSWQVQKQNKTAFVGLIWNECTILKHGEAFEGRRPHFRRKWGNKRGGGLFEYCKALTYSGVCGLRGVR